MNVQALSLPLAPAGQIALRKPAPAEAGEIGSLLHTAFSSFQTAHGFASDFPSADAAARYAAALIDDPVRYAVVATQGARIVGVNFLSEGDPIRGVGPIAVAPDAADCGIGRMLMHNVIERAATAAGVRLLQDTFNVKSLSLYTSLGFRVREPVVVLKGRLEDAPPTDHLVRPLEPQDLPAVAALAHNLTGYSRGCEVRRALSDGAPWVTQVGRRITGYATDLGNWAGGHAIAETEEEFLALLADFSAARPRELQFLFPLRQARLLRWLLRQGLRAEKQMLLMTRGIYAVPRGVYVPSVLY